MEDKHFLPSPLLYLLFLWAGLLLSSHGLSNAVTFTGKTLIVANVTRYGVERLGLAWSSQSPSDCYFACWSKYGSQCQTILFNSDTKLCTPGSFIRTTNYSGALPPTISEGDLFAASACDVSDSFTYVTSGDASACIKASTFVLSGDEAAIHCRLLGSHLFVPRSLDRLELLPDDARYIIGLTDKANEGTFVWEDNGEAITDAYKALLFKSSEPNNRGGDENCVDVRGGTNATNTGNDISCTPTRRRLFACERPMLNSLP